LLNRFSNVVCSDEKKEPPALSSHVMPVTAGSVATKGRLQRARHNGRVARQQRSRPVQHYFRICA